MPLTQIYPLLSYFREETLEALLDDVEELVYLWEQEGLTEEEDPEIVHLRSLRDALREEFKSRT